MAAKKYPRTEWLLWSMAACFVCFISGAVLTEVGHIRLDIRQEWIKNPPFASPAKPPERAEAPTPAPIEPPIVPAEKPVVAVKPAEPKLSRQAQAIPDCNDDLRVMGLCKGGK